LKEAGIYEEVRAAAIKRVLSWQLHLSWIPHRLSASERARCRVCLSCASAFEAATNAGATSSGIGAAHEGSTELPIRSTLGDFGQLVGNEPERMPLRL